MPLYEIQGPDGKLYEIQGPAGATKEQIVEAIQAKLSIEKPEGGFVPATKAGLASLKSDIAALLGRTGVIDIPTAEQYIKEQEAYQRRVFKPTEKGWTEAPLTKTTELLGGSLPYMVAPVAAGAATLAAPVTGAAATALGLGAAGLTSAAQFTGSNIARQMDEGKRLAETELGAAAAAAVPQAALDLVSFRMMPGIRRIFMQAGKDVPEAAAKKIAEQKVSEIAKDYALATGKAMGTEGLTEAGQQVLERLQAGLNITNAAARDEYFESFIGGAVLGGVLSPAGRFIERGGEKRKERAAEEAKRAELAETARIKAEAEEQAEIARRAGAPLLTAEEATRGAEFSAYDAEGRLKEKQQLQAEIQTEYNKLYEQEVRLQDSIKRAKDEGRTKDIPALIEERKRINELRAKLEERVQDKKDPLFGFELKAPELVETEDLESLVQGDMDVVKKKLDKAIDLGDFDKAEKLSKQFEDLKQKARDLRVQPDLFGTRYQTRLELEAKDRKAAEEEMQRKQLEAVNVVTIVNLLNLGEMIQKRRAKKRTEAEQKEFEIEQDRALKRLEFNIDRRGLTAIGVPAAETPRVESEIDKGILAPDVAEKLGVFEDDIALAKRKIAETEDKAEKAKFKAELALLQAKIAQPQRSTDVLDNINQAWEKATAKQREIALDLAAEKIDLFDSQGKLTKQGAEAVKNQVIVEQLTKLRSAGREARDVVEQQRTEEQQAAEAELILSGAKPFAEATAQATKTLPQQRLLRMRERFESKVEGINDQIRYLQSLPTVERPGEPSFEKQIQDLELERREFDAAIARVEKEIGDEVEIVKPTDINRSLRDFSDAIYPLQRGEFMGKRPTEVDKKGRPTKAGLAEARRNEQLQNEIDGLQAKLDIVSRQLSDPELRNVESRNALERKKSKLQGEIKTRKAGLSKQPGGKATFQMLVNRAEKARDEYVSAALNQINGVRAARNLPMLDADAKQKLERELNSKFNEFIKRASYARRVSTEPLPKEVVTKAKTALGIAFAEAGVKGTRKPQKAKLPADVTPFGKLREALDVLREDLDDTIAKARGDVAVPEPKFELKDYLDVLLGRAMQRPGQIIRGESQIEKIADSIERIDEKLTSLAGVGAGPDYISSLKEQIKLLESKPEQLRRLQAFIKKTPVEELGVYEDDPVLGPFIQNPEILQRLYDDARRELPMLKDLLAQEQAKVKTKEALEKLKKTKQEQRDAVITAAQKAQGTSQEAIKDSEIQRIQKIVSKDQKEFQKLGVDLFNLGRAIKVELPAKARMLKEEIATLTKLAKTDRNPRLRKEKIERLKVQLKQVDADIATAKQESLKAQAKRKSLQNSNKFMAASLRNMGVETTITNEGEYILRQIESAKDIKESVENNLLLKELPKFRAQQTALEETINALTKENNILNRRIKLLTGREKKQAEKQREINKTKLEANKTQLSIVDKRVAQIVRVGEVARKEPEGSFTFGQITKAKKALLERIEQTQARLAAMPKVDDRSIEAVLERARIGAIENLGIVDETGKRIVGRKVVFEEELREQKIAAEEVEQVRRERTALFDTQIEALRKEFEERKAELAKVKESSAVKAAAESMEKAKAAIKFQKNEKEGIRLAKLADEARNVYERTLTQALSFPVEEIRRYPAKIAGLTRLKNYVSDVRYVPVKVATKTELFVDNNKIEREAERQRFEVSLRKDAKKTPLQKINVLLDEAKELLQESENNLRKAEVSGNRALITAARAEYLAYRKAYTTVLMKRQSIETAVTKELTPQTASDAAVNPVFELDNSLTSDEKAKIKDAVDSYNINRETSWAFGDEVTDVIDMDAAVKRMDEVVAKAAKRGIKVEYFKTFDTMSLKDLKRVAGELAKQGKDIFANQVQGGVFPDGSVFVMIGHHNNLVDLEKTIAHEIVGHYTIDSMLGLKGTVNLLRRIEKSFGELVKQNSDGSIEVNSLVKKLGLENQITNTFVSSMQFREHKVKEGKITEAEQQEFAKIDAVRELIAYTTEKRIPKGIAETVKQFLQEIVGAVRQFLRDIGLRDASKISTSELYNLIRSAKDRFESGKPIAYKTVSDAIALRGGQTPKWAASVPSSIRDTVNKVVAKTPSTWEKLRANLMGLNFRTQFVDSIDALERIKTRGLAKGLLDAVQAVDLTYFYRMYNQRMSFVAEAATNGVVQLTPKKRADGKIEYILDRDLQKDAASLKKVVIALAKAGFGDAKANGDFFTLYMAAERAVNVGKDKLDYTNTLTEKELEDVRRIGRSNPAIQEARRLYNSYNKDLIALLVQAGAISKEKAAELLANKDYIPYYRQTKDGVVNLYIEGEKIMRIGSITEQPHLKELVGGRLDTDEAKSQPIEDFFTSSLQNTSMIMDLALRNLAMRNTAFVLQGLGLAKRVSSKMTGTNVVRAKLDGEDAAWEISTEGNEVFGDIPAEIIVKGLEGIKTILPGAMQVAAIPADFFRKLVTRDPRYAIRQVFRDSMAAYMATGSDAKPLIDTTGELIKIYSAEGSKEQRAMGARGITGGQVITGDIRDMAKILAQLTGGRTGWEMAMAKLDAFAIAGDSATRVSAYNSFLRQGLSDREATLATLETMNFSRRGISPSVLYLNSLIPFFSANLQGLDVLYRAFTGKMPESERLKVQRKLVARGAMVTALTVAYALMMDDDEVYENANALDRYSNWFVKIPGLKEPFKVPIPFELGWIFKALPEGLVRAAKSEETGGQIITDLAKLLLRSVPGDMPLVLKPAFEVMANYSFFTGDSVVSARLAGMDKEFQYGSKTPEMIKHLGAALSFRLGDTQYGLSPRQLEHLVRGYTGGLPISILGMTDPVFRGFTAPNAVEPSMRITDVPIIGGLFQSADAGGLIERAYETARAADRANKTYKDLLSRGLKDEAKEYRIENIELLGMVKPSGMLTKQVGEISKHIRIIEALPEERMSAEQKREKIDKLRSQQIKLAKSFLGVRERIESRHAQP